MELAQPIHYGKYEAAMYIANSEVAGDYLEACIRDSMHSGIDRKSAEVMERDNILNFAQHFDKFTQLRVKKLFG